MKVYKKGRKLYVNDGDIYCLSLNYKEKYTIVCEHIHGQTQSGEYKIWSEWKYVREATAEEEFEFIELTKNMSVVLLKDKIKSKWNIS